MSSSWAAKRPAYLGKTPRLAECASKRWRCLNGSELIRDVIAGVVFADGVKTQNTEKDAA